jgi:hypothetical protein
MMKQGRNVRSRTVTAAVPADKWNGTENTNLHPAEAGWYSTYPLHPHVLLCRVGTIRGERSPLARPGALA